MKNILYIHAGAEMYGADKILLEIVKGIDKKRFNPIVVLPTDGILKDKLLEIGVEVHVVNYPILRRKYFNIHGITSYIRAYRKKSQEIIKLLKGTKIDIIHANTTAVLEGIYLKYKLQAKLIWHVHEIITTPKFMNVIISFLVGRFSDTVITVSEAVRNNLIKTKLVSSKKVKILYNGVDNVDVKKVNSSYLYKEFSIPTNAIKIGMIGRINAWKGQEDFIKALTPILKGDSNVYAFIVGGVFAGEEWRIDNIKKIIRESGVSRQFRLSDFRNDVPELLNFFDFFVLPSNRPDPLPTVVLEAMSVGKAIVSYGHGGAVEMIVNNETGYLATPKNVQDLSMKIKKMIKNPQKTRKMGELALERQREVFNKNRFIKEIEKIYLYK
ncbi:glycosyltransferase family 4 protein [Pediococcus pentosaceus]|uniref:glycosyltransferase family 4 protein n=1 Tax=Pediococcus pentosaceus TaxID=1255 RepID=UPI0025B1B846|nr:glycosyltransferase family 4 protein [Pediococcus pentosaceus]MDN3207603.1 glycosyltransferase family 4 protein [Pediococcus pentosaceus]